MTTRALVLYAHPCSDSLAASVHGAVLETLRKRGWDIDDCDLYAEGFNPVLSREERQIYHDVGPNLAPVADHVARLRAAQALVMVFPVWNYGYPAILKGYFDRVFLPGVSFTLENGKVVPALSNLRKLAVCTSYGGTRLKSMLAGDPPRRVVMRSLRVVSQMPKTRYIALYDVNRATPERCAAHLARVRSEMENL